MTRRKLEVTQDYGPCEARLAVCQRYNVELLDKLEAANAEVERWAARNALLEKRLAAITSIAQGRRS